MPPLYGAFISLALPALAGVFVLTQILLLLYSAHRIVTLSRWLRRPRRDAPTSIPATWPCVTIQLPLYNERLVAERLIDAAAGMDYPAELLQIQVLDDSTDQTAELVTLAAAHHRARGIEIEVIRRGGRKGYKAGALAEGLRRALGELIVVFDADFVPGPGFLKGIVPYFADPRVGMVQARWGHLNRDRSPLTAAQAVMLDAHFLVEHTARMGSGLFFNFNGTAGAWRRACIESAGGWTHDTLTEDLDLSYRAQLSGWKFLFAPRLEAPAELPTEVHALQSQQRRWAKGSIQTARKVLPVMWRSDLPVRIKLEAVFHLTGNMTYPLVLLSGLLLLPVITLESTAAPGLALAIDLSAILVGLVPVCLFLASGQIAAGARGWTIVRDLTAVLVVGAGLSVNNSVAVLQGFRKRVGGWERTPKTGDGGARADFKPYAPGRILNGRTEVVLALYFGWLVVLAWSGGHARSIPFLLLLFCGLGYVGVRSLWESVAAMRGGAHA
jgi:cellulose synthase/poly-beta-1,6-N-acetylglucosamine synthase-like glycosyltransferase